MALLSADERKLLAIQGFIFLSYALASVFVAVFFFRHSDIGTTILYRAAAFGSMTFFYALSGWTLRRVSSGSLMKFAMGASALSYFFLFYFKEQSIAYAIPLGILDGLGSGNFWAGFNLNQYILTGRGSRVAYFGWASAIIYTASAIGPIVGGSIIAFAGQDSISTGYASLFFLVFAMMSLVLLVAGKLPAHQTPEFRYRHILDHKRSARWKLVLAQQGLLGFYDVLLTTLMGILLYIIIKGEFYLGLVTTVGAILAAIASLVSIRLLGKYRAMFWIGSVGMAAALILFAVNQNYTGIVVYVLSGLVAPFLANSLSVEFLDAVDHMKGQWQQKYHALLERDILLGSMRTASYLILFIFLQFGDQVALARVRLLVLPAVPLTIGVLLQRSTKLQRGEIPVSVETVMLQDPS